jgi:hypothetical protein
VDPDQPDRRLTSRPGPREREPTGAGASPFHVRGHRGIENKLRYIRDVTYGEDSPRVRTGNAPQVMASPRNCTIAAARANGWTSIASGLRWASRDYHNPLSPGNIAT